MNQVHAGTTWWRPEPRVSPVTASAEGSTIAFGGLVAFTAILLLAPQTILPVLKVFRTAFLAAALAIGGHVLDATAHRRPVLSGGREVAIAILLLIWTVLTIPFSLWPGGSVSLLTDQYLKAIAFFWLIGTLVNTRERLRTFAWVLTLCVIPLAAIAIAHFLSGDFLYTGTSGVTRIAGYAGLSGNPNDLALTLNVLIPIAGALLLTSKTTAGRLCAIAAMLLAIPAVIITFSRAGFLTLCAVFLTSAVFFARRRAAAPAAGILALALVAWPLLPHGYIDRLGTIVDIDADTTGSAQGRWSDFELAATVVSQRPLIGAGLGQDILALNAARGRNTWRSVHNAYLEYAVDLGLPGLALFVALLFAAFGSARRVERVAMKTRALTDISVFAAGVEVALIAFAVAAFFHPIAYQFYFFLLAGLAVALKRVCRNEAALLPVERAS